MAYANAQRMTDILRTEVILKGCLPKGKEEALSIVCYKQGLTTRKGKEYIKLLFDNGIVGYNEKEELIWTKKD